MPNFDLIFCCGKQLNDHDLPDLVLMARLDETLKQAQLHPEAQVILAGGKSLHVEESTTSEANAMKEYLIGKGLTNTIILEEDSSNTIEQLCLLKTKFIQPGQSKALIISDEFHIPRVKKLAIGIMGSDSNLEFIGVSINISGNNRKAIQEFEYKNDLETKAFVEVIPAGDHQGYLEFSAAYKRLRQKMIAEKGDHLSIISVDEVLQELQRSLLPFEVDKNKPAI